MNSQLRERSKNMFTNFEKAKLTLPATFTVTAHSGSENTPDNSMEFLEKCVEINAQVAELDVTQRKDGTIVMIHKDLAENDEGVLFEDAIKYLSENTDTMKFNLDLKSFNEIGKAVDIIEKYGVRERCFFTGVREENVKAVKEQGRGVPYYLNVAFSPMKKHSEKTLREVMKKIQDAGAVGINCNYRFASKEMVKLFRENGLLLSFWTANTSKIMKKLLLLAPDNITSRFPLTVRELIKSKQ